MADTEETQNSCGSCAAVDNLKRRVRGITSMSLEWLAERFRRSEKVKEKLANGQYSVDSSDLAKAILNDEKR